MIYINIGSNLNSRNGDRLFNIHKTIELIQIEKIKIKKKSHIYETPSYPNEKNSKFLNLCLEIDTQVEPQSLIKKFKLIEKKLNRVKGIKNSPRTCDIDLIDYKGQMLNLKEVSIPHPRAHLRNFVLLPLQEICPDWLHPVYNKKIDFFIKKLSFKLRNEITRIKDSVII